MFWTVWKARNRIAFRNEDLSLQKRKSSFGWFAYLLWMETKLFIVDDHFTLVALLIGWDVIEGEAVVSTKLSLKSMDQVEWMSIKGQLVR